MRKTLILFIVFILLLSGCVKEETMYIKPFMLAEEDINNMLERNGGIFEYYIDSSIKMITLRGIKYEENTEPEVIFNYRTAFNSDFSGRTSRFIFQISKDNGNVSVLTVNATAEAIIDKMKSYRLHSISLINEEINIIPDTAIPLHVMPRLSEKNQYFDPESFINNPEIAEQYSPIIVFSITFHSYIPEEE
jgi:PBP1b-binding outer membrane lipoprotein LpoB